MEALSITTIKILLLFLPGIIYCMVHEKITFHSKREFNYFLIRSFVFGILSYFIYGVYLKIFKHRSIEDISFLKYIISSDSIDNIQIKELVIASFIGILMAIFYAWLKNQHVIENVIQKEFYTKFYSKEYFKIQCPFAKKHNNSCTINIPYFKIHFIEILKFLNPFVLCDGDVWNNIFNSTDQNMKWVSVYDNKLNLRYEGWVYKYSDTYKENELFLRDVIVFDENDEKIKRISGLYITRKPDDITIEFFAMDSTELINRYKENEYDRTEQ